MFCSEQETVAHLFFDFIVARNTWPIISKFFVVSLRTTNESVARFWVSNNKNAALNFVSFAALWVL